MQRELELKVELSKADLERLAGELSVDDLAIGHTERKSLRTVYFDAPEHDLHAIGISLRLRKQDSGWLQTVKADHHVHGGISNPVELEVLLTNSEPDLGKIADNKIKKAVKQAVKGTSLRPVFETVVQRTTRNIRVHGSEIELALDEGEVHAGQTRKALREAEFELKSGSAEDLLLAAEKLLSGHELKLSTRSKADRGYCLALGKRGTGAEPEKARLPHLRRKETCSQAFSDILESATRQILTNRKAVLDTDDPDAAHQLHIGLRRLRSALRALRPLMDGASLRAFEQSAREMGRCVGKLRDADVLISGIIAPIETVASDKTGFPELHDALVRDRRAKRDDVRAALRGAGWSKLGLYLTIWPRTLEDRRDLDQRVIQHARRVLAKAWKKPAKLGQKLRTLDVEGRHEMRKALKTLRYQAEFFAPLFNTTKTEPFIADLKNVQDVFGYINDVRMVPHLIEAQQKHQPSVAVARAASYVAGRHEAEAARVWQKASKVWKALKHSPHFWA
jgi:inorganic triphosphatase YgiF